MKRLLSTAASCAWLGVAFVGLVVVALVLALQLIPRLGAGQDVIDAAQPAFTDERVAGTRAGIDFVSAYVDAADPLVTARGGAAKQSQELVRIIRHRTNLSTARVRRTLRREAPHTEALTRALPLSRVAREVPRLTAFLATTLSMTEEQLADLLERRFPALARTLTALPNVTDGWNDVPAIDGLTRLKLGKPVRTVPGLRKYYRDDLVEAVERNKGNFQDLAGAGGIGYIPYLLLVVGVGLLAFGVRRAQRSVRGPASKLSWAVVVGVGVVLVLLVGTLQYFPRLSGANDLVSDFEPIFERDRAEGASNGIEIVHESVLFGDPVMTARGGAARETRRLLRFVSERTGLTERQLRRSLRKRAPRTLALLDALPLSSVSNEVPQLVAYLSKTLKLPGDDLVATLRKRTPALAQTLLTLPDVTVGWNAIPGTRELTRFDGVTPVGTMPELDDYLRQDVIPLLPAQRESFDTLATTWPPLNVFAPLLLAVGAFIALYGVAGMLLVTRRY